MNLKQFEQEIEEELARMKPGRAKKQLEKMYYKFKGKKMLKVGDKADNIDIDEARKTAENKIDEVRENGGC